jgi:3-deoxy-D-manno-octulosonic acid kinase
MCYDVARITQPSPQLLVPEQYGEHIEPVQHGGRQAAWFVTGAFGNGVLRHYRRGGLLAKVIHRRYVWCGEDATRCFREFQLLVALRAQGLAVPIPLAAAYWRGSRVSLTYEAAILMQRLPRVKPLACLLDQPVWTAAAAAIARLHQAGVWHADLNAYNILLDHDGRAWIIDFDRGRQNKGGWTEQRRQRGNLKRLRRSLEKIAGATGHAFFTKLHQSYQEGMALRL